jgi:hypothetical protein
MKSAGSWAWYTQIQEIITGTPAFPWVNQIILQYLASLGWLSSALFFKKWKRCRERFSLMIGK